MAAAADYGRANRQLLTDGARRIFRREAGTRLSLVHDVSHNVANPREPARYESRVAATDPTAALLRGITPLSGWGIGGRGLTPHSGE
ncbi:hypothetical protein [Streptomyces sp. BRA346]|uniref:hypothetical protein n=1 Tax=Streptomyces sp. BRA346 TaxID=2878199 RepID=UPI004063A7E9